MTSEASTAEPDAAGCAPPVRHNQIGQKIGAKGFRTRQRLIDVTVELLDTLGLRDLTVAEVARVSKTSPATFYVYFDSVQAVVLAALEQAPHSTPELLGMLDTRWTADDGLDRARAYVNLYTDLWNRHRTIFRVRNMAAEEGDMRFVESRSATAVPMIEALAKQIAMGQAAGQIAPALHPRSLAGTILTMMERLSSVGPQSAGHYDISYDSLRESAAHMVAQALGAYRLPTA